MTFGSGLDGTTPQKFGLILDQEIDIIIKKVAKLEYNFTRFREKLIVRSYNKNPRQIAIPTVRDKLVLRLLHEDLKDFFTEVKHERPQKIIHNIKKIIHDPSLKKFVRIDIKGFFPSIDHEILNSELKKTDLKSETIDLVTKAIINEIGRSGPSTVGIPQGLSISNILAEIYLKNFDKILKSHCAKMRCYYFRYVDDVLILTPNEVAHEIFELAETTLQDIRLNVHKLGDSKNKSSITDISDNSAYLGYELSASGVRVKKESLQRMFNNVHKVITRFKYDENEHERNLFRLNLKITGCVFQETKLGWLHFFSEIDNVNQLHHLDHFVISKIKDKLPKNLHHRIKSFLRTYFEILHNHHETNYIPNFDNSGTDYKIQLISLMTNKSNFELGTWNVVDLNREYVKIIKHETKKLESDIISLS